MLLAMGPLEMMDRHPLWMGLGYACFAGIVGYTDVLEGKPAWGCLHWWVASGVLAAGVYHEYVLRMGPAFELRGLAYGGAILVAGASFALFSYVRIKNRS